MFAAFTAVSDANKTSALERSVTMDAKRVCDAAAGEINTAESVGDGYSHSFLIPDFIFGRVNFSVQLVPETRTVACSWSGGFYESPVLAANFTGNVRKGTNTVTNFAGVVSVG